MEKKWVLEVENVDAFYGDLQVTWDVSFRIGEGEVVVLIGPNGAGKSTILKTICGLIRPKKGEIKFLGSSIIHVPPEEIVERGISLVPEGRKVFTRLTVLENLRIGAYVKRAKSKFQDTLEGIFELFPVLKEKIHLNAGSLSGGEQQMLAIGRALMSHPKLLLMDEPSLGLSPILVRSIFEMIPRLREQGITVLLVEQNVRQALKVADYAYVLKHGRIVLEGRPEELTKSEEIQEAYLGTMVV